MAKLRALEKAEWPLWDAYVVQHAQGTLFHTTKWLLSFEQELLIWVWEEEGSIQGGFATVSTSVRLGLRRFANPPYTPYHFPLYGTGQNDSVTAQYAFYEALLKELKKAHIVDLKCTPGHHDVLPFHWHGFEARLRLTMLVQAKSFEAYLANLSKDYRKYYRRMEKLLEEGELIVEENANQKAIIDIYNSIAKRRSFGVSESVVQRLFVEAYDPAFLHTLSLKSAKTGEVLSGVITAYDEKAHYFIFGGNRKQIDKKYKHINVLNVALAIRKAIESGKTFDFEGSMLSGVEAFNRYMGGVPEPVYRLRRIRPRLLKGFFAYFGK